MRLVLHLVWKDARRLRLAIAGVAGLTFLAIGVGRVPEWVGMAAPVAWMLLAAMAVEGDSLANDRAWWLTRPYGRGTLLISKLVFVAVFVQLPVLGAEMWALNRAGWPPGSSWAGVAVHQLNVGCYAVLPAMAIASVARRAWLWVAGVVVVVLPAAAVAGSESSPPVSWVQMVWTAVVLVGASAAVLGWSYATRRLPVGRVMVAGGAVALMAGWHWLTSPRVFAALETKDFQRIQLKIEEGLVDVGVRSAYLPLTRSAEGQKENEAALIEYFDAEVASERDDGPPVRLRPMPGLAARGLLVAPPEMALRWGDHPLRVRLRAGIAVYRIEEEESVRRLRVGRCRELPMPRGNPTQLPIECVTPFARYEQGGGRGVLYLRRVSAPWPGAGSLEVLPRTVLIAAKGEPPPLRRLEPAGFVWRTVELRGVRMVKGGGK